MRSAVAATSRRTTSAWSPTVFIPNELGETAEFVDLQRPKDSKHLSKKQIRKMATEDRPKTERITTTIN
eukprot:11361279-Alexandrium_andersonii.AAC.1